MRDDKTGWLIIFDGTDRGLMGRELLPPRPSNPSGVWSYKAKRLYTRTGRYAKRPAIPKEADNEH
jgi:hypothetical protein